MSKYEEESILQIELTVETPPWDLSSFEYSRKEQSMFNYRGWFVSSKTPARGQLFSNSVTLYAYDAVNVMDNNNFSTVMESFVIKSLLQIAQAYTKKVSGICHLVLSI